MNLKEFKIYIENQHKDFLNRCNLINEIMNIKQEWSYILRAFLFCSNSKVIAKSYILQKVNFMLENPSQMDVFLDYCRNTIYIALSKYFIK